MLSGLSGIENFVRERDDFMFNSFRNFKPVKRFQNRSYVFEFWSLDNSGRDTDDRRYTSPLPFLS